MKERNTFTKLAVPELEAAWNFSPRGQELGHELGYREVWEERIQAREKKLGEISDQLREKLRIHLLSNSGFPEKWL